MNQWKTVICNLGVVEEVLNKYTNKNEGFWTFHKLYIIPAVDVNGINQAMVVLNRVVARTNYGTW